MHLDFGYLRRIVGQFFSPLKWFTKLEVKRTKLTRGEKMRIEAYWGLFVITFFTLLHIVWGLVAIALIYFVLTFAYRGLFEIEREFMIGYRESAEKWKELYYDVRRISGF